MRIEELSLDVLIPYEHNPRKNDDAVEAVANSIREFGFKVPIIVDRNNVIVAGHTRWKAAESLGLKTVPVIRADDLSEEQIRAFRLADNKVSEFSEWDYEKLNRILEDIDPEVLESFGFENHDPVDFDKFFGEAEEKEEMIKCPLCGEEFNRAEAETRDASSGI